MSEKKTIEIAVYRDPAGRPTCAADFRAGLVCRLLQSARMGSVDVCALQTGRRPCLERYDGGTGYLMPAKVCPVWAGVDIPADGGAA